MSDLWDGTTERCAGCDALLVDDGKVVALFDVVWALYKPGDVPQILIHPCICSNLCAARIVTNMELGWLKTPAGSWGSMPFYRRTRVRPFAGGSVSYELGRTRAAGWNPPEPDPTDAPTLPESPAGGARW